MYYGIDGFIYKYIEIVCLFMKVESFLFCSYYLKQIEFYGMLLIYVFFVIFLIYERNCCLVV